jgi:hypothetical protein
LSKLFGFAQLDFAGTLPLVDGRYLARDDEGEKVLVLTTLGAAPAPARRRRRDRKVDSGGDPSPLPLTRVTGVRAFAPFGSEEEAARWLDEASEAVDTAGVLLDEAAALLNRALHAQAVATADPYGREVSPDRAVAARIGYGSGEEVAESEFSAARSVDVLAGAASKRRRREDLRPQERIAGVLGGREQLDACETLLLRARADLDGGRMREGALQLRVGLEALLVETKGALADPGHEEDLGTLNARRAEAGEAANVALTGDLGAEVAQQVRELLELCERVVRRRRVLRG